MIPEHEFFEFEIIATPLPPGASPEEYMAKILAECPHCQEAMARGEKPLIITDFSPPPPPQVAVASPKKIPVNSRCPCGSARKYKKCCGSLG